MKDEVALIVYQFCFRGFIVDILNYNFMCHRDPFAARVHAEGYYLLMDCNHNVSLQRACTALSTNVNLGKLGGRGANSMCGINRFLVESCWWYFNLWSGQH